MNNKQVLKPFIGGNFILSETEKYVDVFDPSTGQAIAASPCCTEKEVEQAIQAAKAAFPAWRDTPVKRRAELMFALRSLIQRDEKELALLLATENGKTLSEAEGDIGKAKEMTELACSAPSLLMGESLMDTSAGYDTTLYREPLGVCVGIAPWNFPAMIPMGWMTPLAVVCGNTFVLKPASSTPMTSLHFANLYKEAGFPDGVVNIVPCSRSEAELLIKHPDVRAVSFVGSTPVGLHVYATAAAAGKRVQALCEAKNHALVLKDAPLERTVAGIINSAFGCAGERCMALPVVVAEESIADALAAELVRQCKQHKVGPAYDPDTSLGPVVSAEHKEFICSRIQAGINEGAEIILDGRTAQVPGYENGFYVGHTIFDNVTDEMTVGAHEIFGPVLCIKRVKDFEEGITLMNNNPFANGSVIFTQSGHYAREFAKRTDGGMVGINVGIPVPMGAFPFSGHKNSFFGDLHCHGKDAFRFYTESKCVTSRWFDEEEKKKTTVNTWDGSL